MTVLLNRFVGCRSVLVLLVSGACLHTMIGCAEVDPGNSEVWRPLDSTVISDLEVDIAARGNDVRMCRADMVGICVSSSVSGEALEFLGLDDGIVLGIIGREYPVVEQFSGKWDRRALPDSAVPEVTFFVGRSGSAEQASFRLTSNKWGTSEVTVDLVRP